MSSVPNLNAGLVFYHDSPWLGEMQTYKNYILDVLHYDDDTVYLTRHWNKFRQRWVYEVFDRNKMVVGFMYDNFRLTREK